MTDTVRVRGVQLGERLIDRLVGGDVAGAAALLAPVIEFRALTPPGMVEVDGREPAAAVLAEWFPPGRVEALEVLEVGSIGDCERVSYRVRWTAPGGESLVFEQHAFYGSDETGITWLRLVCSGDHPVDGSHTGS